MSRTTPDQIIAHADLLRAVDRLLEQVDTVREKREALDRLFSESLDDHRSAAQPASTEEGRRNA